MSLTEKDSCSNPTTPKTRTTFTRTFRSGSTTPPTIKPQRIGRKTSRRFSNRSNAQKTPSPTHAEKIISKSSSYVTPPAAELDENDEKPSSVQEDLQPVHVGQQQHQQVADNAVESNAVIEKSHCDIMEDKNVELSRDPRHTCAEQDTTGQSPIISDIDLEAELLCSSMLKDLFSDDEYSAVKDVKANLVVSPAPLETFSSGPDNLRNNVAAAETDNFNVEGALPPSPERCSCGEKMKFELMKLLTDKNKLYENKGVIVASAGRFPCLHIRLDGMMQNRKYFVALDFSLVNANDSESKRIDYTEPYYVPQPNYLEGWQWMGSVWHFNLNSIANGGLQKNAMTLKVGFEYEPTLRILELRDDRWPAGAHAIRCRLKETAFLVVSLSSEARENMNPLAREFLLVRTSEMTKKPMTPEESQNPIPIPAFQDSRPCSSSYLPQNASMIQGRQPLRDAGSRLAHVGHQRSQSTARIIRGMQPPGFGLREDMLQRTNRDLAAARDPNRTFNNLTLNNNWRQIPAKQRQPWPTQPTWSAGSVPNQQRSTDHAGNQLNYGNLYTLFKSLQESSRTASNAPFAQDNSYVPTHDLRRVNSNPSMEQTVRFSPPKPSPLQDWQQSPSIQATSPQYNLLAYLQWLSANKRENANSVNQFVEEDNNNNLGKMKQECEFPDHRIVTKLPPSFLANQPVQNQQSSASFPIQEYIEEARKQAGMISEPQDIPRPLASPSVVPQYCSLPLYYPNGNYYYAPYWQPGAAAATAISE